MNKIKVKAPATVANLSCGYDILGLCLDNPSDEIEISKITENKILIESIKSNFSNIPTDPKKNTGGLPAILIHKKLKLDFGFKIKIKKGIPLFGGMGSSAATAVGVVYGINELLGNPLSDEEIISYALEGERISSKIPHADNIGPCLLGGLILIKSIKPVDLIKIPIGPLYVSVIHPDIKISTKMAREILPKSIKMEDATKQWSNIAGLTYGFTVNDFNIIKRSMEDVIIEPIRSKLIPGFHKIKNSAIKGGAIGCSISGSGPSIFAISQNKNDAEKVLSAMRKTADNFSYLFHSYISPINHSGVTTIS